MIPCSSSVASGSKPINSALFSILTGAPTYTAPDYSRTLFVHRVTSINNIDRIWRILGNLGFWGWRRNLNDRRRPRDRNTLAGVHAARRNWRLGHLGIHRQRNGGRQDRCVVHPGKPPLGAWKLSPQFMLVRLGTRPNSNFGQHYSTCWTQADSFHRGFIGSFPCLSTELICPSDASLASR